MGVQEGERGQGGHHRRQREGLLAGRVEGTGAERPETRLHPVPTEEPGPAPGHGLQEPVLTPQEGTQAEDTASDQGEVGRSAEGGGQKHMATQEAQAQDKGILGPDGHDEGSTEAEAFEDGKEGEHDPPYPAANTPGKHLAVGCAIPYLFTMQYDLRHDARTLEDAFFLKEDQRLMESLREMKVLEETTGMLSEVSGITDPHLLVRLAQLKVTPSAAASLAILPLIEVAWADGAVDAVERQAILESLDKVLFFQTIDRDIVEAWLGLAPPPALFTAWETYAKHVAEQLTPADRKSLSDAILTHARQVAQAAGGFLGFSKISKPEQAVLDRLEKALS